MLKSKTVITALGAALASTGAALEGSMAWPDAINVIVMSVLSIFLRHGISKTDAKVSEATEAASAAEAAIKVSASTVKAKAKKKA
tara:strand:+ start:1119 stop:1373 length:255 start_codon:yes stop_codon:yes gene_type:complete